MLICPEEEFPESEAIVFAMIEENFAESFQDDNISLFKSSYDTLDFLDFTELTLDGDRFFLLIHKNAPVKGLEVCNSLPTMKKLELVLKFLNLDKTDLIWTCPKLQ
jgi:hypothetical protein